MSNNLIGATLAIFTVTLSDAVTEPVDVAWSTRDGTAKAGTDYEAANGVITFLPGETAKQVQVTVYGQDDLTAADNNFYIELSPPSNAVLATTSIEVVISLNSEGGVSILELVVPKGKRGLKGDPGLSAYEHAVFSGRFDGTEQEWLDEELRAGKAAQQAEAAATSATIAGKVYLTPAEGVNPSTGVPVGAYFNVRSTANDSMVDEYRNVNGVATPTGKSYPSTHKLNQTVAETQQSLSRIEQSANQAIASTQIYRDQSMSFANQAEAAATAATISAGVFETPEAGVDPTTGVEDGKYFNVRSPSSDSYIDEYQNIGGNAIATGKSYLSSLGVQLQAKLASTVFGSNGKSLQEITDSLAFFITPEMFGATGQNLEKDQAAFNSMIALGVGQTWQLKSGREYHVTNITPPANTIIYANWAKLKKASNDNQNVLNLYNSYNKVYNIEVDGNKSGITTTGFCIRSLGDFNDIHGFYVHDAGNFGVVVANCENSTVKNGRSINNGVWAVDGSTKADGIYFSNTKNCVAENCTTTGNGRTGLVQTSYAEDGIKPELCHNNSFINCQASDNAYSDVNTEGVSKPTLKNLVIQRGVSFSRTVDAYLDNIDCGGIYATQTVRPTVKKVKITQRGVRNSTDNFFISGQDITVETVSIDNTLAPTLAGSSFKIVDSGTLSVDTVNINRAFTGVNISAASTELLQNLNVGTGTNKYRYNSTNYTALPIIVSRTKIPTALDEATFIGGADTTVDANTFENGTFYSVDTGDAGTHLNFPVNFGDRYLTIETRLQSGVRSYQVARSIFVNTVMYRVKTAAAAWTEWVFMIPRKQSISYGPPNLEPGESVETTLTMSGVTMNDTVVASFSQFHKDINVQGRVSAENTVSVVFHNHGTTPIDLVSGTLTVKLF